MAVFLGIKEGIVILACPESITQKSTKSPATPHHSNALSPDIF
jgi:hypothetical protein